MLIAPFPLAAQQAGRRWIVDNASPETGDGSPSAPFLTIAEALAAAGEGDSILVSAGVKPYAGGLTLKSGQVLRGEGGVPVILGTAGAVITVTGTASPVTIEAVSVRASGPVAGIVIRSTTAPVTLNDVQVATTGGVALSVHAAARVVVSGASTLDAVDAAAVKIEETELDVTLRRVSARGEKLTSGIVLRKTPGRFVIEGESAAGSGGTIEGASARAVSAVGASNVTLRHLNIISSASVDGVEGVACGGDLFAGSNEKCHAAVYLHTVDGVTLEDVLIERSGQAGLVAHRVRDLTLTGCTVRGAGDALYEHGLILEEITGHVLIAGTSVERSASRHLMLHNSTGALSLEVRDSSFLDTPAPNGQQGILVTAAGNAVLDLAVRKSTFARAFSHALEVSGTDTAKVQVRVTGSSFDDNGSAISLSVTQAAILEYAITDNPSIVGSRTNAVSVYLGEPSTGLLSGTVARNTIGRSGRPGSATGCDTCNAIVLSAQGRGRLIADVQGNVIQGVGGSGISAVASRGSAELHLTASSNLLREGSGSAPAIRVESGALPTASNVVCADLGGQGRANSIEGEWGPAGPIHVIRRFTNASLRIPGLGADHSATAAAELIASRNRGTKVRAVLRPESEEGGFAPADRCTMPALAP